MFHQTNTLTTGLDTLTGTAAADTFLGVAGGTAPTIIAGDSVDGGAGTDTMIVGISGATTIAAGMTLTAIETVRIVDTTTVAGTLNLAGSTGIQTVDVNASSGAALSITNVGNLVALNLTNTAGVDTTLAYSASVVSGSADVQSIVLSNAAATGTVTVAGVETVNVTSAIDGSTLNLVAAAATTVTLSGAGDTTLNVTNAAHTSLTAVNAATATGDLTVSIDPDLAAAAIAVTTGAGADMIDVSAGALGAGDTINGGAGNDTVRFVAAADTNQAAIGGATAATRVTLTSVETLELQANHAAGAANANDFLGLDMDTFTGVTAIVLDSNDTDTASDYVLTDVTAAQAGAISIQGTAGVANGTTLGVTLADGTGTADTLAVTAAVATGNVITIGDDGGNIENLTIAMNGNVNSSLVLENGDFSTGTAATLTVTGGAAGRDMSIAQTTSNVVADVVNLSGVASDVTIALGAANQNITGGAGGDTFNFAGNLTSDDTVNGGLGSDTLTVAMTASVVNPVTLTSVETLEIQNGATASVNFRGTTGLTTVDIDADAGHNTDTFTAANLVGVTTYQYTAEAALGANDNDFAAVTVTNGYTGTNDAITVNLNASADVIDAAGMLTVTGVETATIAMSGDNTIAVAGITSTSLTSVVVTATTLVTTTSVDLGDIVGAAANNSITSFDATGANVALSVDILDAGDSAIVNTGTGNDNIDLTGSAGVGITVTSGAGDDTVLGSAQADIFNTGAGDDIITGTDAGDDIMDTGAGNDTINVNAAGTKTITTGAGADIINIGASAGATAASRVVDFAAGDRITIDWSAGGTFADLHVADGGAARTDAGDLARVFTGDAAAAAAVEVTGAANLMIITNAGAGIANGLDGINGVMAGAGTFFDVDGGNTAFATGDELLLLVTNTTTGQAELGIVTIVGNDFDGDETYEHVFSFDLGTGVDLATISAAITFTT